GGAAGEAQTAPNEERGHGGTEHNDPEEEEHDLRSLAHHRHEHDHGEGSQWSSSCTDIGANLAELGYDLPSMLGHPDIVPGKADHGDDEHGGVEQLLA